MSDPRLDLSPLDPSLDAPRWERLVRTAAARGAEGYLRRRPPGLAGQLAAWLRPALALAAAVGLLVGVPAWLRAPPAAAPSPAADEAARLAAFGAREGGDDAAALLQLLGGRDDAR